MELVISLGSDLTENIPHPTYKDQAVYVQKGPINTVMKLRVPLKEGIFLNI
jgi:hypothetical protein